MVALTNTKLALSLTHGTCISMCKTMALAKKAQVRHERFIKSIMGADHVVSTECVPVKVRVAVGAHVYRSNGIA